MVDKHIVLLPSTTSSNAVFKTYHPPPDSLDRLPDHLLLLIFHHLTADVKSLLRCAVLCHRLHSLISQIQHLTFRVPAANAVSFPSTLIHLFTKPLQTLTQFLSPKPPNPIPLSPSSLSKPFKLFKHIRLLKIQLPLPELQIKGTVLLKWKAKVGSLLDNFVVLTASSVEPQPENTIAVIKSSLYAAATRLYSLQLLVSEHRSLTDLVLTDSDNQGELCMDKEQLDEFRTMLLESAVEPTFTMRMWYESRLELPDGSVLEGATLAIIRTNGKKLPVSKDDWVADAFQEEPYHTVAEMLFKGRAFIFHG